MAGHGNVVTLLSNAGAGNGAAVQWPGGRGVFMGTATYGGGNQALQMLLPDGVTWVPVPIENAAAASPCVLAAAGCLNFALGPCMIRAVATTATVNFVYAQQFKS